jgi:hypothetical protein
MSRLRWMEALVEVVAAWLGSARSVKVALMARSEALVVPGVSPLDQW